MTSKALQITHQCMGCLQHHPENKVLQQDKKDLKCPLCDSPEVEELQCVDGQLPRFHAQQAFEQSTFTYAQGRGIDSNELDALAQAIQRLMKHANTVVTKNQAESLQPMVDLGYVALAATAQGTFQVDLLSPAALLSSYFWSVWVPHHLQSRGYQVAVLPHLDPVNDVQHCTVVFRIPGPRESSRIFLAELARKFDDQHEAEIIHIQAGHVFAKAASHD